MIINIGGADGGSAKVKLVVSTPPTKTMYLEGESIDLSGCVVTAEIEGFPSVDVTNLCTFSPSAGTVVYEDTTKIVVVCTISKNVFKTSIPIKVAQSLASLRIDTPPKTNYTAGEPLDLSNLVVSKVYTSGKSEVISPRVSVTPVYLSFTENNATFYTYNTKYRDGHTQNTPVGLTLNTEWEGYTVVGASQFVLKGGSYVGDVKVGYVTYQEIANPNTYRSRSVSIYYNAGWEDDGFYYVRPSSIVLGDEITSSNWYNQYEVLSNIGVLYNNNGVHSADKSDVPIYNKVNISDNELTYTTNIEDRTVIYEDTNEIVISYTENNITKTASISLTVQRVLQSIAVTTQPTTTTYKSGTTIDTAGMVVTATYDRTTDTVSGYSISPLTAGSTEGTQTETVTYTENGITKTTTFDITVSSGTTVTRTEVLTNKIWIDGKPIYRKVFDNGSYANDLSFDTNDLNIETLIRLEVIGSDSSSGSKPIWVISTTSYSGRQAYIDKHGILVVDDDICYERYVIIEYTKINNY